MRARRKGDAHASERHVRALRHAYEHERAADILAATEDAVREVSTIVWNTGDGAMEDAPHEGDHLAALVHHHVWRKAVKRSRVRS